MRKEISTIQIDPLHSYVKLSEVWFKNTEWTDCKTVNDKTIVVVVCNDCKHTWEQGL